MHELIIRIGQIDARVFTLSMGLMQVLGGLYTIRFAIGGARTELCHVDAAWEVI